jgi:hypothetical protein
MDKGPALNKRVWSLFEKAGFDTKPSSLSDQEYEIKASSHKVIPVDLYASKSDLGITIVGSNKSGKLTKLTEHVNNYKALGEKAGADKVLFVFTHLAFGPTRRRTSTGYWLFALINRRGCPRPSFSCSHSPQKGC